MSKKTNFCFSYGILGPKDKEKLREVKQANSVHLPPNAVVKQTRTKKIQTIYGNDWKMKSRGLMHVCEV